MLIKRNGYKIRLTRCYLVEVCDNEENELISDFCFTNKDEAINLADKMACDLHKNLIDKTQTIKRT